MSEVCVRRKYQKNEKILLMLAPFWAPLIPPLGSSCIKSHINKLGYSNVKIVDGNLRTDLWEFNSRYLRQLEKYIPEDKKGNYNMVAYDILMNHLMVHINYTDENEYINLIQHMVKVNFFVDISKEQVVTLNEILEEFYGLYKEFVIETLEKEKPAVFGMTVYSVTLAPSVFTFRIVKQKYPHIMTVMGGGVFADQLDTKSPNFEVFVKKTAFIDVILVGEGENLFYNLLENKLPDNKKVFTLEDIAYEVLDLSKASLPDYSDLEVEKYTHLCSYTARSCPYQCSFCSETVQWGKYRKKNAKKIADELLILKKMYGRSLFLFGDSLINPIVDDFSEEMIKRKKGIYWDAYLRADKPVCDIERTKKWREGGFYRARLGIESGSPHVLELMNKKTNPEQIKAALRSLATAGIKTTTYWVIGHPGETEKDFQETLELVEECKDDIYEADWHPFYFFPTGQTSSVEWRSQNKCYTLYPESATELLITQTWCLDVYPGRELIYDRLRRFAQHCKEVGIPNPYSLNDIYMADQRWIRLHENAVPAVVDIT